MQHTYTFKIAEYNSNRSLSVPTHHQGCPPSQLTLNDVYKKNVRFGVLVKKKYLNEFYSFLSSDVILSCLILQPIISNLFMYTIVFL